MSNSLDALLVYQSQHPKIRLGSMGDGGYVIADDIQYDLLLSCGISNNVDFEEHFIEKYKTKCLAFDGTINDIPNNLSNIEFIRKNITNTEAENTTNLLNIIENNDNIFLKMDIETNEYQWLGVLENKHLMKFKQIIMEFHFPFAENRDDLFERLSYPISVEKRLQCLQKIVDTHYLIHLHGNNYGGTMIYNNILIPNVFECTYVRKDLCNNIKYNNKEIPDTALDYANKPGVNDIHLKGYPFEGVRPILYKRIFRSKIL